MNVSAKGPTKAQDQLIAYLFEGRQGRLTGLMTGWITTSKLYMLFVEEYKDKIRKKLRVTRQPEAIADLSYELQIPFLLLQDRRFELAYEPYASRTGRAADFAVSFRKNFTFNLEITHLRSLHLMATDEGRAIDYRLVDVLCSKLTQMLAKMANVLFVVLPEVALDQLDPAVHLAWIRNRAERDPNFCARQGFGNASDFFKSYERLSALALFNPSGKFSIESNPGARARLPKEVVTALTRALGSAN